ncbi:hypothetical protein [Streptomyces lancefieldiae]|uniref:Uncharacterized protein n=1 Tax=Streptomyces lancefieldiae TaxID=3075520 RepID=A0ABU3B1T1_9ACTN|nr:hypothetical protein [Streptomyces sp. DSM 40712]MDT0616407.1 hypothetical protein [Streptomyces sp. DSM 40712]
MTPDELTVTGSCWSCAALTTMCARCATVVEIEPATGQPTLGRTSTSVQMLVCSDCVTAANNRAREHGGPTVATEPERHASHRQHLYI